MRILFSFVGGRGHLEPLVPIARAGQTAGHAVAFGCAPSMVPRVQEAGFRACPMGADPGRPRERLPLRPPDPEREARHLRDRFARHAARERVPATLALCDEWQPDVLVCDETDFGAMLAAECLGLPSATVLVIAAGSFVRREVVGDALDELRTAYGLEPDPELEMLHRGLVLSPFPRSYRDPADPLPPTAHCFRPSTDLPPELAASPWPSGLPDAPSVYLTLGTIFNTESGDLLVRAIEALRELPSRLIVTVGPDIDPQEFGRQPAHVRIARFIPQSSLLPDCDLVVCHGGSGSVMGALAHGLPSVLLPIGADQPLNAERCASLGVAEVLDAMAATAEGIRRVASKVLGEPSYRRRAARLGEEIGALPGPAHAVDLLERLVARARE